VQSIKQRRLAWLSIIVALSLTAAACGDDDDAETSGDDTSESGGEDLSGGSINVSGSSTVEPITAIVAEEFDAENGTNTTVDGPGTGDGFELFCGGETDVSDASRAIDEEEAAICEDNGIEYVELKVAIDGMAVMTSPSNDSAPECLSFADLYALIGPEAEGISTWADAATVAEELGSTTELPDEPLDLTGPGTESGTYDSFVEIVIEGLAEERSQDAVTRDDYDANADDNIIIQNIEASDTSLGWVGWAFASAEADAIRNLAISEEPDGDCVEPDNETIADGSYPLARDLYIYVNKANAEENAALAAFVDFYLADLTTWVEESGYVPLPDDAVEETASAWESR
jgi:phosphate transport system substrate-binding protein